MSKYVSKCFAAVSAFSLLFFSLGALCFGQAKETVLYSFGGYANDGVAPTGGLVFDASGNIYGTTPGGGINCETNYGGCGTVFELSPSSGGWTETVLYSFCTTGDPYTCSDGSIPLGGLIFDKLGNLYGTTAEGGNGSNGTVYELSPPSNAGGSWTETVLWAFGGTANGDGSFPNNGKLNWPSSGNLYGTTGAGGKYDLGTVFQLTPEAGGGWSESVIHSFDGSDGADPFFGVAIDEAGNLYGTANVGGIVNDNPYCENGCGTVFELTPSGGAWLETVYRFDGSAGDRPSSPISMDREGNLYGSLQYGGTAGCNADAGCGGVFRLARKPGGGFTKCTFFFSGQNGGNPSSGVLVDQAAGTLVGTSANNVYMIKKGGLENVLYQFCSLPNCADGEEPSPGLIVFRDGQLYGTTLEGGADGDGVVYSISQ